MTLRHPHVMRLVLAAALAAVSIWPARPAVAAPAVDEPRFLIESIEVRGARPGSTGIVVAESLLEAGGSYSEAELSDAVHRIERLPFVLAAELSLGKGSERGRYVLYLDVRETRRFFYSVDNFASRLSESLAFGGTSRSSDEFGANLLFGSRFFAGRYNMFFVAAGDEVGLQAGYTRYDLFDRGAVLSFAYGRSTHCCPVRFMPLGLDPSFTSWLSEGETENATLTLGVPLAGNHALRAHLALRASKEGSRRSALNRLAYTFDDPARSSFEDLKEEELELAWLYDTTDDPVFPRRGSSWVATLDVRTLEARLRPLEGTTTADMSSELVRITFLGRRHWALTRRQSVAVGVAAAAGRSEVEDLPLEGELVDGSFDTWEWSALVRHGLMLKDTALSGRRFRQLRWENRVEWSLSRTSSVPRPSGSPLETLTFASEIVYRHGWGVVRVGLRWIDVEAGP